MALNRYSPHLLVLAEDEATRSIATGFADGAKGQMRILHESGGWPNVLQEYSDKHVKYLRDYPEAHIVLVIDFDDQCETRMQRFRESFPEDVAGRTYVLGAVTDAEALRREAGMKFADVGLALARECEQQISQLWATMQLNPNVSERERLLQQVRPFLFS